MCSRSRTRDLGISAEEYLPRRSYFPRVVLHRAVTWFLCYLIAVAVVGSREFVSTGCWFCHRCRHFNFCFAATPLFPPLIPLRILSFLRRRRRRRRSPPPLPSILLLLFLRLVVVSFGPNPHDFLHRYGRSIYCSGFSLLRRVLAAGIDSPDFLPRQKERGAPLIGKRSRISHFYDRDGSRGAHSFLELHGDHRVAFFVGVQMNCAALIKTGETRGGAFFFFSF